MIHFVVPDWDGVALAIHGVAKVANQIMDPVNLQVTQPLR